MKRIYIRLMTLGISSIVSVVLYGAATSSSQARLAPYSMHEKHITPATLYGLMPQPAGEVMSALQSWYADPNTDILLKQLLSFSLFPHAIFQARANKWALDQLGYTNLSNYNYVFALPGSDFLVKIAGPVNRLFSMLMGKGIDQNKFEKSGEFHIRDTNRGKLLQELIHAPSPTYQTASRAAYYLLVKQLIEKLRLSYITTPETYLVTYPHKAATIDDNHALIIQRALPSQAKKLTKEDAATLPNEAVSQLVDVVIAAGLWSIPDNIFVEPTSRKIHLLLSLVDLEQPNNTSPDIFFHQSDLRFSGNVVAGLEGLLDLFAQNPFHLALIKERVEASPIINASAFDAGYRASIMSKLSAIKSSSEEQAATE